MHHRATPRTSSRRACLAACLAGAAGLLVLSAGAAHAGPPAALAPADTNAVASFEHFAADWMQTMRSAEARDREASRASYTGYGDGVKTELRATGNPRAPYVGILRYEERSYACQDAPVARCGITRRVPVTEIFRFQDGRWVY